jgi:hypothetical protein
MRTTRPLARFTLAATLAIPLARPAEAQPASNPAQTLTMTPQAQAHFDKGKRLFVAQMYGQAVDEFKAAYLADPQNDTIYAIAQSERLAGDCKDAINAYRQFLAASESTTDAAEQAKRDNAQTMVDQCGSQPTTPANAANAIAPSSGPATPAGHQGSAASSAHKQLAPVGTEGGAVAAPGRAPAYAVGAGAIVLLGTGAVLGVLGQQADKGLHSRPASQQQATDDANAAKRDYLLANVLVPAGLVAGAVATYLWIHESSAGEGMEVSATVLPGGAAIGVSGTWGAAMGR